MTLSWFLSIFKDSKDLGRFIGIFVRKLPLKLRNCKFCKEAKTFPGIRWSLLFSTLMNLRCGRFSGPAIESILFPSTTRLCKLVSEGNMLGDREEIKLFLSSRTFNFFSPSKSDLCRAHMELSFNFNTSRLAGRTLGTRLSLFFQSSRLLKVLRVLKVSFSTDSVPLASRIKSSRANSPVKLAGCKIATAAAAAAIVMTMRE